MITRISGTAATFVVCFTLLLLLMTGVIVFDTVLNEYPTPKLTQVILLLAPAGWSPFVNPVLFAAWYWLVSKQDPPPPRALIWHIFALVFSAILMVVALQLLGTTPLSGKVSAPPGHSVVNILITGGLAFAVWRSWKRNRAVGKENEKPVKD